MPKAAWKPSVYGEYVHQTVLDLVRAGQVVMTCEQVAMAGGVKVTGNLRRRMHQLVREGVLSYCKPGNNPSGRKLYFVYDTAETR